MSLAGKGEMRSSSGTMRWEQGFSNLHLETGFLCSQQYPEYFFWGEHRSVIVLQLRKLAAQGS